MRNLVFTLLTILCSTPIWAQKKYRDIVPDTAKVHYIHRERMEDAYIFNSDLHKNTVYVNEQVTTHVVMPENIKLVDISTNSIIGNQCADNIVRIKPAGKMYDNELAGTMTVIGERHIAQFNVVYVKGASYANSIYNIDLQDAKRYNNPDVLMQSQKWLVLHGLFMALQHNFTIFTTRSMALKLSLITYMLLMIISS